MYETNRVRPPAYAEGYDHIPLVKRYSQIESDVQLTRERNVCFYHPPSASEYEIFGDCTSPGVLRPHLADRPLVCVVPKYFSSIEFVVVSLHLLNPSLICPLECLCSQRCVDSTT